MVTGDISLDSPGSITVAVIMDPYPTENDRIHTLGHNHAKHLLDTIFAPNPIAGRQQWPPIITSNCYGVNMKDTTSFNKKHAPGFQRGLILAHRQIWEEFYRFNRDVPNDTPVYNSPKVVIFESDAMAIDPVVNNVGYQSVQNMTSDLHVIGHCYDRQPGKEIPECNHAYALTVRGCKLLMKYVDHCARSGPLDVQFKEIGRQRQINWTHVPASFPYGISNKYIMDNAMKDGYTVEYGNQIGGLFYQVRFDNILPIVENNLYRAQWPFDRVVYVCRNGSLHLIPDHPTFIHLGFDYDIHHVTTLPHFQVEQQSTDPIPSVRNH